MCCLVMTVGLMGALFGFLENVTIPLFVFDIPTWVIGLSAAFMGLRYWRRIPALEQKIEPDAYFRWSNFWFRKAR
jgi:hypothetical protein